MAIKNLSQLIAMNSMRSLERHAGLKPDNVEFSLDFLRIFRHLPGQTNILSLVKSFRSLFENGTQLEPKPWLAYYHRQDRLRLVEAFIVSSFQSSILTLYDFNYPKTCFEPYAWHIQQYHRKWLDFRLSLKSIITSCSVFRDAYPPKPEVSQPNLSTIGVSHRLFSAWNSDSGFQNPEIEAYGGHIIHGTVTICDFLKNSKAAGMTKVLIGVQRNAIAIRVLAIGAFKKVFQTSDLFCDPQSDDALCFFSRYWPLWNYLQRVDCHRSDQCRLWPNLSSCGIAKKNITTWGCWWIRTSKKSGTRVLAARPGTKADPA